MRLPGLLVALLLVTAAYAAEVVTGDNVTIPSGSVVDDDLFVAGGTVTVYGKVTGDLLATGGTVDIAGEVRGSVLVAGGTVQIRGTVGGSVYGTGGTVLLDSLVTRNVAFAGGTVTLQPGADVGRDLLVAGGTVSLAGKCGGDVQVGAGSLDVASGANVAGNLSAVADDSKVAADATIGGTRDIRKHSRPGSDDASPAAWAAALAGWRIYLGLGLLIIGLLIVSAAPRLTEETQSMIRTHPWGALLAGLIAWALAGIILALTACFLPLPFIWAAVFLTGVYISPLLVAIAVGRMILKRSSGGLATGLLLGLALYVVVTLIPVIGFFVSALSATLGMGALILALQGRMAHPFFAERVAASEPEPAAG